jgi:hypothetical protein
MKKSMVCFITIFIIFIIISYNVNAISINSGFDFYENPYELNYIEIINDLKFIKTDSEYQGLCGICSYDANMNNQLAVAFNPMDINNQRINIYDENGVFEFGFRFSTTGGYQIEYDLTDNYLMIYLFRGDLLLKINDEGQIIKIVSVTNNQHDFDYMKKLDMMTSIIRNGNEYVRGNLISESIIGYRLNFTTIFIRKPNHDQIVVFNNTFYHWIIILLFPVGIIVTGICILIYTVIIKRKEGQKQVMHNKKR